MNITFARSVALFRCAPDFFLNWQKILIKEKWHELFVVGIDHSALMFRPLGFCTMKPMKTYKYTQWVTLGYTAEGKRKQKRAYGNTKNELANNIARIKKEFGLTPNASGISFKEYAGKWLSAYKVSKSSATQNMYARCINKTGLIDMIPVKDIKPSDLQLVINENLDYPRTCQQLVLTLRQIFEAAIDDGIIYKNPAARLETPKYKAGEERALKPSELDAIRKGKFEPMDLIFIHLLYYFGLRPGEALALMPSDFDFKTMFLSVRRGVGFNENSPYLKDTKTGNERMIPVPAAFVKELQEYCKDLKSLYLIHNADGSLMSKSGKISMWRRIKKEINSRLGGDTNLDLTDGLRPYTFRHDYCTRLYYSGISLKKAAQLMGHEDTQMIMKVYAHLDDEKESLDVLRKMSI